MVNADVLLPVQRAVFTRLDAELTCGVHDLVPEGAAYPYVVIGEATDTPDNAHDRYGHDSTVTLHVWSTYHGTTEALGIAGELIGLLDHQPLVVDGFDTVAVRHRQTVVMRDPDADLRHVVVRFAITTEQPPA